MRRWSYFLYGVVCHLLFLAVFTYMAGFVGGWTQKSIDTPPSTDGTPWSSPWTAAGVDLLLVLIFALQHSVMARPWFKERWTRIIPQPIERSTYVLASCLVCGLLMWQWRPLPTVIWNVEHPVGRGALYALFAFGWLLVPAVSFMIHHFDLFGIRQVWLNLQQQPYTSLPFRTPWLYSRIRHPLYVGWTIAFWATPTMTVGHLLFAAAMTFYMAVAVVFEERDLVSHFGEFYRAYQRRVPMFVPRVRTSEGPSGSGASAGNTV